ncbi:MotA/TolQ/ExbB proton channel family protein [Rosistilla ulvae]|nr:MotA/TolQ/ExbB proton channel family protein [Rosistilla ulvae]
MDAGNNDHCPDCGIALIVPGTREKLAEAQRQLLAGKEREKQALVKKAETQKLLTEKLAEEAKRQKDLQLDRDPLREWFIYAAVVGVLLAFAAGIHLVRAVASDSSGLCAMIFGLFFFGIALNFRAVKNLKSEFVCAAFLVKKLNAPGGFSEVVRATPAGVFHQHIQDLAKIAKHDPNVSQDSLITLLYSKMMARSKIIDVLAGVLVSLGLIGTIVGLISMTNGLSSTLDSLGDAGDATELMVGMRTTMQGLGTAFYTTLVGAILGSVVLRVLNNVYTSNVDHFVSYIAALTEVRIAPQLRKSSRSSKQEVLVGEIVE